jgi:hypothetical protein
MNTRKDIYDACRMEWCGWGSIKVTIKYRGKRYQCVSHNTQAYDCRNWEHGDPREAYTSRQAYQVMYDECKAKNNLK